MTAITHALSRTVQLAREFNALEQTAIFCAAGLLVTLIVMKCGLDLRPAFVGP